MGFLNTCSLLMNKHFNQYIVALFMLQAELWLF